MTPVTVLHVFFLSLVLHAAYLPSSVVAMPSFPLNNTAIEGLRIPALGVGTG
jgi:hypothetical protein